MKKKLALLSLISAFAIGASLGFTACGDDGVGEHDHIYDGGTVTTEPTCYKEGVRTYSCTVEGCTQTKTAPVAMIAHSWNEGEITSQSTCSKEGVKTYTCTVEGCGKTKEEAVEKSAHTWDSGKVTKLPDFLTKGKKTFTCLNCKEEKVESSEAHADFSEQFYTALTEQNNWLYGYANTYNLQTGAVDFVALEESEGGVWKSEKTQIGKGKVDFEDNAVVAYRFNQEIPASVQTKVGVSFDGEASVYLIITDKDGALKGSVELSADNKKDWSYPAEDAVDIAQGDTFYLVLDNNGEGKASGNLAFTLTAPCVHVWGSGEVTEEATCTADGVIEYSCISCDKKLTGVVEKIPHEYGAGEVTTAPTETENGVKTLTCANCDHTETKPVIKLGANYFEDFSTEDYKGWEYGYTSDYDFSDNTFTFNKLTAGDGAWLDNGGGIEIKSDWLKNETGGSNAVVRYNVETTREVYISISFSGSDASTRMTGRLNIIKADGSVQICEFLDGTKGSTWTYDSKVAVEEGGSISVLFFNEKDGWNHGKFAMTVSSECLHSWDDGKETPAATCSSDGVKTFTCLKCGETKTEAITERPDHDFTGAWITDSDAGHYHKCNNCDATDKPVAHSWESKGVITDPTYDTEGEEKVECTVCHRESTRKVPASNHKKGEYDKDETYHWFVCSAHDDCGVKFEEAKHKFETEVTAEYEAATCAKVGKSVWQCVCGAKEERTISKDTVDHDYAFVTDGASGHHQKCTVCNDETEIVAHYSDNPTTNTKPTLYANGSLVFDCDACGEHIEETFTARANLKDDFTTENQNGAWKYGSVEYTFGEVESIEFTAATENSGENGEKWGWLVTSGEGEEKVIKADIRPDFIQVKTGFAAISYTFSADIKAKLAFKFTGNGLDQGADTVFNIRIGITKENGEFYAKPEFKGGAVVEVNKTYEFKQGDTIYFIIEHASGWDSGKAEITLTKVEESDFAGASFEDDFSAESNPNGAWSYGTVDYTFGTVESIEFTPATENSGENGEKWGWLVTSEVDGETVTNADIRADFFQTKTGYAAIAYKFSEEVNANVAFKLTGNGLDQGADTAFNVRIGITKESGEFYANPEFKGGAVVEVNKSYEFKQGDTIYFIIEHASGWDTAKIEITINQA